MVERDILCYYSTQKQFYTCNSYSKLYKHIYICPTQRIYKAYIYISVVGVKVEEKRVFFVIISNVNWNCRRFSFVLRKVIFNIPVSNRPALSAMSPAPSYNSQARKCETKDFSSMWAASRILFILYWIYISKGNRRHGLGTCTT